MARAPLPIICTPDAIIPDIPCLICARSRQELLAAFDAFLCQSLNRPDCSVSALLPNAAPYMNFSERELVSTAAYLWLAFIAQSLPGTDTSEQAMGQAVSPFLSASNTELLAIELWLLCQMTLGECNADDLINGGRCYCVSIKELLAIRVYLLGLFVNNFAIVDMTPATLLAHVSSYLGSFSLSAMEATITWGMCHIYDVVVESQQPN